MAAPVIIRRHPSGPRCWVVGQRVHHGATGCVLLAAALLLRRRALLAAGLVLCAHDRADARVWFRRAGLDSLADTL